MFEIRENYYRKNVILRRTKITSNGYTNFKIKSIKSL